MLIRGLKLRVGMLLQLVLPVGILRPHHALLLGMPLHPQELRPGIRQPLLVTLPPVLKHLLGQLQLELRLLGVFPLLSVNPAPPLIGKKAQHQLGILLLPVLRPGPPLLIPPTPIRMKLPPRRRMKNNHGNKSTIGKMINHSVFQNVFQ